MKQVRFGLVLLVLVLGACSTSKSPESAEPSMPSVAASASAAPGPAGAVVAKGMYVGRCVTEKSKPNYDIETPNDIEKTPTTARWHFSVVNEGRLKVASLSGNYNLTFNRLSRRGFYWPGTQAPPGHLYNMILLKPNSEGVAEKLVGLFPTKSSGFRSIQKGNTCSFVLKGSR